MKIKAQGTVLIVDDKIDNLKILIDMLETLNLDIVVATNAKEAYERVALYEFDLILLDIVMPDIDGYEVCKTLKNDPDYKDIPIIFISALNSAEDKIKGFSLGADDYLGKPFIQKELIARIELHLEKSNILKSLKNLLRKSYHELYNPLAVINTSLEMQTLKNGTNRYTDAITVASRTLQTVYDDLYYSISTQKEKADLIDIDLVEFIENRIEYFYYFKKSKNLTIDFRKCDDAIVKMKELDLLRIVDNTLSNAIKYAYKDTKVIISVSKDRESIIFSSNNRGSTIENPQQIFKQGYREGFENVGMGIGLEIVASICYEYNIEAEVVSEDAQNCFRYKIPKL